MHHKIVVEVIGVLVGIALVELLDVVIEELHIQNKITAKLAHFSLVVVAAVVIYRMAKTLHLL